MRAAIMRAGKIVVDQIAAPVPGAGEVLVKTLSCGICGSDLHALKHGDQFVENLGSGSGFDMDLSRDIVMGHEFCAEILDFGPGLGSAKLLPVGQRICAVPMTVRGGAPVTVGYSNDVPGGYAEQMVLAESMLLPVQNGLSSQHAALTEPMAVGYHAVQMARLQPTDLPLVIGCGPVGLAVISALRLAGVGPIIAADYSPARRALAERLGADVVIDPAEHSPYSSWSELAGANGTAEVSPLTGQPNLRPGVFFECVGVPGVIDQMLAGAQRGCRFVIVGVCMEADVIRPTLAITKELNLQFVLGYTPEEFAQTLHHIAEGVVDVEPLITDEVGVAGVADAFERLESPEEQAKIIVEPWR